MIGVSSVGIARHHPQVDIDTNHFLAIIRPFASLDALRLTTAFRPE